MNKDLVHEYPDYPESPYHFHTYRRAPVVFVKGKGATLWDDEGRKYLDFFSGLAVCGLGHSHPGVAKAVAAQARTLTHVSNIFFNEPQLLLARELTRRTFGKVFFSNSGAEANECAIKLARRFGINTPVNGSPRHEIICFENSFHGRTFATLAACGQEKLHKGFGPLPGGYVFAKMGDLDSVEKLINARTCAVWIEPVQGEGGLHSAPFEFFRALQDLCRKHNLLFMLDEIQTGAGRTGTLFAYQQMGLDPDVLSVAKGLANGLPLGATLAKEPIADMLKPGDHGSTFGGGPVVCRAALAVLKALNPPLLRKVGALGRAFKREIESWKKDVPAIKVVRGLGLMIGVELDRPCAPVVKKCREAGLLVNCTADRVVRLLPPFCLTDAELKKGLALLKKAILATPAA